jgi:hypothetical protein
MPFKGTRFEFDKAQALVSARSQLYTVLQLEAPGLTNSDKLLLMNTWYPREERDPFIDTLINHTFGPKEN